MSQIAPGDGAASVSASYDPGTPSMIAETGAAGGAPAGVFRVVSTVAGRGAAERWSTVRGAAPAFVTAVAFMLLFAYPFGLLVRDWWTMPEAGHGLLLAPVALWLAWRTGLGKTVAPNRGLGLAMLVVAVVARYASGLAAELFTMRASMLLALGGLTVYHFGFRQLLRWWLPFLLACLAIPLPELVTQTLALPLQFRASRMGAALMEMRGIPVRLTGNVIRIPGHELFVTEACSGLRSLTALLSLAILMGGLMLRAPLSRVVLVALAIPIAIVINGVRVFVTGFLVYFVSPELGSGFMHITEGWLMFLVSFACIGGVAWVASNAEGWASRRASHA
jgi:exosortase